MRVIVFAGPSVARERIESLPQFEWRPPVSQGDVYRAAKTSPNVIAIIDGYFEGVPSVWHKEILWALSQGIHVFGASSMGALRAAELHQFGMRGVGEIFQKYRDGVYEDDDEVAVLHGPSELEYLPLNVPMVNVRATLDSACAQSVIDAESAEKIALAAKSIFYQERQWKNIVGASKSVGVDDANLAAFEQWLPDGQRDVKRDDAEQLLRTVQNFLATAPPTLNLGFHFEWTVMWDGVVSGQAGTPPDQASGDDVNLDLLIIDELRMQPEAYRSLITRARLKQIALREAERKRLETDIEEVRKQLQKLRELHGLYSRAQLDDWMDRNDLLPEALQSMLEDEQKAKSIVERSGDVDSQILINELRLRGDYESSKSRAEQTSRAIVAATPKPAIKTAQLLAWFFELKLGIGIPGDLDAYIDELGFRNRDDFYEFLQNQYLTALANQTQRQ